MKEILLYRGCTTPVRLPAYEASTKLVLERLGVKVIDMVDTTCCGSQYVESLNSKAFTAMGARILALAEREGKDILAICGACSGSLKHTKHILDSDESLRKKVNSILAHEDLEYTGKAAVKHLLQIFKEDIGFKTIERAVSKPYRGVRLAAHYGCHVTRPHEIVKVDDPENPTIIDRIIEFTGATSVDYTGKTRCCGGPLLGMDESLAEEIGKEKVNNILDAGAKGIITACAFCDIQLTQAQLGEGIKKGKRIPVIPLPQFLGAALGIQDDILGFHLNKISAEPILATLKGAR